MSAFLVLDIAVHDARAFMQYVREVPAFIAKHGGKYLVQGDVPDVLEGDWSPERLVILQFPDKASARKFLADLEFAELVKLRQQTTTSKLILVEGAD